MSYVNDFEFDFEIGDEYEMSPIEGTYVIGRILSLGGECRIEGNSVIVTKMPGKTPPVKPETKVEWFSPEVTPVEQAPTAPEVKEEPKAQEEVKEASAEVKPTPIKRAPKPKADEPKEEAKPEEAKTEKLDNPIPAPDKE